MLYLSEWKMLFQLKGLPGSGYDSACGVLVNLRDAYELQGNSDTFRQEFKKFMTEHSRRKAFITRLEKAGLR